MSKLLKEVVCPVAAVLALAVVTTNAVRAVTCNGQTNACAGYGNNPCGYSSSCTAVSGLRLSSGATTPCTDGSARTATMFITDGAQVFVWYMCAPQTGTGAGSCGTSYQPCQTIDLYAGNCSEATSCGTATNLACEASTATNPCSGVK